MIVLRGNNVYPSAIQAVLHRFAEVAEYRIEIDTSAALAALRIEIELKPNAADVVGRIILRQRKEQRVADQLHDDGGIVFVTLNAIELEEIEADLIVH